MSVAEATRNHATPERPPFAGRRGHRAAPKAAT